MNEDADISAFNGSYNGMGVTNSLGGSIMIDGTSIPLSGPLDPTYNQTDFDATYTCHPDLAAPIASQ